MKKVFICVAVVTLLTSFSYASSAPALIGSEVQDYCATEVFTNGLSRELKNVESLNISFSFLPINSSPFRCESSPARCSKWVVLSKEELDKEYISGKAIEQAQLLREVYPTFLYPQHVSELVEKTLIKALRDYGGKQVSGMPCRLPKMHKPGDVSSDGEKLETVSVTIKVYEKKMPKELAATEDTFFLVDVDYYRGASDSRKINAALGGVYLVTGKTTKEELIAEMWKPWAAQIDGPHPE